MYTCRRSDQEQELGKDNILDCINLHFDYTLKLNTSKVSVVNIYMFMYSATENGHRNEYAPQLSHTSISVR